MIPGNGQDDTLYPLVLDIDDSLDILSAKLELLAKDLAPYEIFIID